MKNFDIFGGEAEPYVPPHPNKYKTMQQLHGIKDGEICGKCKHFLREFYHGKTYFKCEKWIVSNSSATDIRKNAPACGIFEKEEMQK